MGGLFNECRMKGGKGGEVFLERFLNIVPKGRGGRLNLVNLGRKKIIWGGIEKNPFPLSFFFFSKCCKSV